MKNKAEYLISFMIAVMIVLLIAGAYKHGHYNVIFQFFAYLLFLTGVYFLLKRWHDQDMKSDIELDISSYKFMHELIKSQLQELKEIEFQLVDLPSHLRGSEFEQKLKSRRKELKHSVMKNKKTLNAIEEEIRNYKKPK